MGKLTKEELIEIKKQVDQIDEKYLNQYLDEIIEDIFKRAKNNNGKVYLNSFHNSVTHDVIYEYDLKDDRALVDWAIKLFKHIDVYADRIADEINREAKSGERIKKSFENPYDSLENYMFWNTFIKDDEFIWPNQDMCSMELQRYPYGSIAYVYSFIKCSKFLTLSRKDVEKRDIPKRIGSYELFVAIRSLYYSRLYNLNSLLEKNALVNLAKAVVIFVGATKSVPHLVSTDKELGTLTIDSTVVDLSEGFDPMNVEYKEQYYELFGFIKYNNEFSEKRIRRNYKLTTSDMNNICMILLYEYDITITTDVNNKDRLYQIKEKIR